MCVGCRRHRTGCLQSCVCARWVWVCVCVCVCVRAYVRVSWFCVCVGAWACVCMCTRVFVCARERVCVCLFERARALAEAERVQGCFDATTAASVCISFVVWAGLLVGPRAPA